MLLDHGFIFLFVLLEGLLPGKLMRKPIKFSMGAFNLRGIAFMGRGIENLAPIPVCTLIGESILACDTF